MSLFNFITIRLGKDSIPDIQKICTSEVGLLANPLTINVKCTQVPDSYKTDDYAFLWLGSDNNKGMPTQWKQGFKAVGRVRSVIRGKSYNDTSETSVDIVYIFHDSVNRMDILRCAPIAYYWCSSMPLIGLDDHANQTIRNMTGNSFADLRAFFSAIEAVTKGFRKDIIQIEPEFNQFFNIELPNPQFFPTAKNLNDTGYVKLMSKRIMPLQQIFYGAPGTGKSNNIKRQVEDAGKKHHRTTFHPDSDYSTFVGAYKPSMDRSKQIYTSSELIIQLNEIKDSGVSYPCQKFASKYWESLKDLSADETKRIITSCGFTESMTTEVLKGIAIGQELFNKSKEGKIIYAFTPQAFTNAYVDAWKTEEDVYLIIEEINRGNCAQIFGDLFQLLDRKNGISEYPIDADSDLESYLFEALKDSQRTDFPVGVKEGKKLVLPSNLYIWATMNTSDQSLFPIDSAFKRRWEWKYIPIKNHPEENYKIKIGESVYDWWGFLTEINKVINTTTSSEDKKLGYFFAKAEDGVIKDEQFVGKVLFYLWNDVFKNYGFDNDIFNKVNKDKLAFSDFFNADGSPNHENVNLFMKNLKVKDENKKEETNTGEGDEQ